MARSFPRTVSRGPLAGQNFESRAAYERALSASRGYETRTGFRLASTRHLPIGRARAYGHRRPDEPSLRTVRAAQAAGFPFAPPRPGLRRMQVITSDAGRANLTPRNTRGQALAFAYHDAVRHYVDTGDDSKLRTLRGRTLRGRVLETDPEVIDTLARQGRLDDFSPYAEGSA